jgi:hypothetical protein
MLKFSNFSKESSAVLKLTSRDSFRWPTVYLSILEVKLGYKNSKIGMDEEDLIIPSREALRFPS